MWRALKRFVLPTSVTGELVRALDAIWEWSRQFDRQPWLDGVLLTGLELGTAGTTHSHKLGRVPRGFIVLRGQCDPTSGAAAGVGMNTATDKTIVLTATADGFTVDLWVY